MPFMSESTVKARFAAVRDTDMHLRVRAAGKMSENRIKRSFTRQEELL